MPPLTPPQRHVRLGLLACAALALALPVFKILIPSIPALPCGFKFLTGLPCLFCGGTRSACAALRGDFERSLYLNLLSIPALLAIILIAAVCIFEILRGRPLAHWEKFYRLLKKNSPIVLAITLAWWCLHIITAVRTPKSELLDPEKPVAARLCAWLHH